MTCDESFTEHVSESIFLMSQSAIKKKHSVTALSCYLFNENVP